MERKLKDHEIREPANTLRAELEKEIPILARYRPLHETLSRVIQDYLEECNLRWRNDRSN